MDSPNSIGGRDTDISQIGYSLRAIILEMYPGAVSIDSVQSEIDLALVLRLDTLIEILERGELMIENIIDLVSKVINLE